MARLIVLLSILFFSSNAISQATNQDSTKTGPYYFKNQDHLSVSGYFKNSKRHKIWNWYNPDGTLKKQMKYKNGQALWILYFEKNKPWLKINRKGKRKIIRACECREGA